MPVQYQVVRLYEDLLEILPSVLSPVPIEVSRILNESSLPACWLKLRRRDEELVRSTDDDARLNASLHALQTLENRRLDTLYLNPGANIWLWRSGETLRCQWDNRVELFHGKPAWSAQMGSFDLNVSDFVNEVTRFHKDLMAQMRDRVAVIKGGWHRAGINIDIDLLVAEQDHREKTLEMCLAGAAPTEDWDAVLQLKTSTAPPWP